MVLEKQYQIVGVNGNQLFMDQNLDQILMVQDQIPEFERPYGRDEYSGRLCKSYGDSLTLLVKNSDQPVGFLASYQSDQHGEENLYLWMAGVVPEHRGNSLMSTMFALTEWWAVQQDYSSLSLKTFPKFKEMISLLKKRDFLLKRNGKEKLYWKQIRWYEQPKDFHESSAFRESESFDLDVSWNVQTTAEDIIKTIEYVPGMKLISPGFYRIGMESGKQFDLLPTNEFGDYQEGDQIEFSLNGRQELAWLLHPGKVCNLKNKSLEARNRDSTS